MKLFDRLMTMLGLGKPPPKPPKPPKPTAGTFDENGFDANAFS